MTFWTIISNTSFKNGMWQKLWKRHQCSFWKALMPDEMPAIAQQFTSDVLLIPIPNDVHTTTTENHPNSISVSSVDENSQKLELKICELNKSVNHELVLLNQKWILFLNIWINLSTLTYTPVRKIIRRKYIGSKEKPSYERWNNQETRWDPRYSS